MSVKLKDDKPTTSSSIVACCQSSGTTPDNSIVEYIDEDIDTPNNNSLFHAGDANEQDSRPVNVINNYQRRIDQINFTFPKRPTVDIEFHNMTFTSKAFSFQQRRFGK